MKMQTRLTDSLKHEAHRLGFDLCRILPLAEAPHAPFFEAWIEAGRAGEMTYLERFVEKRRQPALLATKGDIYRSLIVLAVDYYQFDLPPTLRDDPSRGIIASYAWGVDYHDLIRPLLYELDDFLRDQSGRNRHGKGLVDTGPVLERDWAHRAGIGFTGKNCCTIRPGRGSWLFLATLLVPEELDPDPSPLSLDGPEPESAQVIKGLPPNGSVGSWSFPLPLVDEPDSAPLSDGQVGTCGHCVRCLDACPTDAFVGPLHLDPQRCISYWTIESHSAVPLHLRSSFSNRIFGCDICQEVCPWNRHLDERRIRVPGLRARDRWIAPPLLEGFGDDQPYWRNDGAFEERFDGSPVLRAGRAGMGRNVAVALGNWGEPESLAGLHYGLIDPNPLVRRHAAWGVGRVLQRLPECEGRGSLRSALESEADERVREEIRDALS